jgi:hypothetical protein
MRPTAAERRRPVYCQGVTMTPALSFVLSVPLVFALAGAAGAQPASGQPPTAPPAGGQSAAPPPAGPPPTAEHAPPPPPQPVSATDAPPGPFALDVRLAMPSFNTGSALADPLGLRTSQLPSRGWGLDVGAHVYPLRSRRFALGLGASLVRSSGSKAPDPEDENAVDDPTIETRFDALVPQVSLNFGSGRGWSYIGGGFAFMRRVTGDVDAELADGPRLRGIHYGGGARWFAGRHVAFSFDLRFYRIPEQAAEGTTVPFQPKSRLFLASVGLSFK